MYKCTCCLLEKDESEFRKSTRPLWHTTQCKACLSKKDRERRLKMKESNPEVYQKNLEKERERGKKRRATDQYKAASKARREAHKEQRRKYLKEYRKTHNTYSREKAWKDAHKEHVKEYMRDYYKDNREKLSLYNKGKYDSNAEYYKQKNREYYNSYWREKRTKRQEENPELNKFKNIYYWVKQRCQDRNCRIYKYYWWRGIVCGRNNFQDFYNDMRESFIKQWNEIWFWRAECQLDRINNDWNYCKENCRWVTAKQNNPDNHAKEREIRKICFILSARANAI